MHDLLSTFADTLLCEGGPIWEFFDQVIYLDSETSMLSQPPSDGGFPASEFAELSVQTQKPALKKALDPEQVELLTATANDFLPPLGHWTTLGGLAMVGGFCLAVAYAAIAPYTVVVNAPAVVRPAGELRIVQAPTGGTIQQINIQENQVVTQGEVIATIDSSQLNIKESQLQGSIKQNQLQLNQITAELRAMEIKIAAETIAMQRSISSAIASLSRSEREHRDQQITSQTQVQEAEANLSLAREELNRFRELSNTGAVAQLQIKEKESSFQAAQARLRRNQAGLNPSHASVEMAQERIAQTQAQGESTLASLKKEQEELIRRRLDLENQLNTAQKELQQVKLDQQKMVIRASESGIILKLELRNAGQVVRPGDAIAQIAPNQTPFIIKARIPAQDIASIRLCAATNLATCTTGKAFMRISAYPYTDYGTLPGIVRAISPDAISPDAKENQSSKPFYEVIIQPEKLYLERNQQHYPIKAGMEVSADIVAQQETILSFILRKARLLTNF